MRVNIYNEELTDRVERTEKVAEGIRYTGLRFFIGERRDHMLGDDDSSAVTFWFSEKSGPDTLRSALKKALELMDQSPAQS